MAQQGMVIEIKNLDRVFAKLAANKLYHPPVKRTLGDVASIALMAARGGAPKGATGKLSGRLASRVNPGAVPRYVVVKTDATFRAAQPRSRGGKSTYPYSYPKLLEFSPRSRHRDWLINAVHRARGRIRSTLGQAARAIEAGWRQ